MNGQKRDELTERSNKLRIELKVWEKEFSAVNHGKKAAREDIKNNPNIAAKYKEYNRSRDILSGKVETANSKSNRQTPRKRKLEDDVGHDPSKRQQIAKTPSKTPSKGSIQPWEVDPYDSPSIIRALFTPSRKTLGPTPQKDGVVLGIFDLLQEQDSPTKMNDLKAQNKKFAVQATPRKGSNEMYDTLKHSRTPASAGKRYMLDAFATPLKTREFNGQGGQTPSSVSKLHFNTPSFLRRDSQRINFPPTNDNAEGPELSPQMVRVPRKPLVRGLSSILAGLRKIEEDAADENSEALREMEEEEAAKRNPLAKPAASYGAAAVADSHPGFPLGAFDDEAMYDSQPDEQDKGLGPGGQPLKVYKKKGQKRTTRRVNMKPTRPKPQAQAEATQAEDSDDELAMVDKDIPETEIDTATGFMEARNFDSDTQSEYTASEGGTRYKRPNQSKKSKSANKDGRIKTAARKVNAMAHQNFKRLKLRNSGAKGGAAHNSRFRRRK